MKDSIARGGGRSSSYHTPENVAAAYGRYLYAPHRLPYALPQFPLPEPRRSPEQCCVLSSTHNHNKRLRPPRSTIQWHVSRPSTRRLASLSNPLPAGAVHAHTSTVSLHGNTEGSGNTCGLRGGKTMTPSNLLSIPTRATMGVGNAYGPNWSGLMGLRNIVCFYNIFKYRLGDAIRSSGETDTFYLSVLWVIHGAPQEGSPGKTPCASLPWHAPAPSSPSLTRNTVLGRHCCWHEARQRYFRSTPLFTGITHANDIFDLHC